MTRGLGQLTLLERSVGRGARRKISRPTREDAGQAEKKGGGRGVSGETSPFSHYHNLGRVKKEKGRSLALIENIRASYVLSFMWCRDACRQI